MNNAGYIQCLNQTLAKYDHAIIDLKHGVPPSVIIDYLWSIKTCSFCIYNRANKRGCKQCKVKRLCRGKMTTDMVAFYSGNNREKALASTKKVRRALIARLERAWARQRK